MYDKRKHIKYVFYVLLNVPITNLYTDISLCSAMITLGIIHRAVWPRVPALLRLVHFFHNVSPIFLPLRVPVFAPSPLSDDVSSEACLWRGNAKGL